MKLTLMQFAMEGRVDNDHPPMVFQGHLDKEQCEKLAVEYGCGVGVYPFCYIDECDEDGAAFYACYSRDRARPPEDEDDFYDWVENTKASLEVWFHHIESKSDRGENIKGDVIEQLRAAFDAEDEEESVDGPTLVMTVGGLRRLIEDVSDDTPIQVAPTPDSNGWTNWILNALHQDNAKIVLGLSEGTCDCDEQSLTFMRDGEVVRPIE